jgi:hypothetical protein
MKILHFFGHKLTEEKVCANYIEYICLCHKLTRVAVCANYIQKGGDSYFSNKPGGSGKLKNLKEAPKEKS